MAWIDEVTEMVRVLIGDMGTTPTYCDDRIQRVILVGTHQVINDVAFPVTYTLNIVTMTMTPDPTDSPRDEAFLYLVSLKSACLIMSGEARTYAISSMKITDGPSSVDTGASFTNVKILAEGLCNAYLKAKNDYIMGTLAPGAAILTPTTQEAILGGFLDTDRVGRFNNNY
jgi:hypothetical protein